MEIVHRFIQEQSEGVLLHNGNVLASIPVAYSQHMKETYDNMRVLLTKIKYTTFHWRICGDLKVIALLMGMQPGYTKFCCFICEWDSRNREEHYKRKEWPITEFVCNQVTRTLFMSHWFTKQHYYASLAYQVGVDEKLLKGMDQAAMLLYTCVTNFLRSVKQKLKKVSLLDLKLGTL